MVEILYLLTVMGVQAIIPFFISYCIQMALLKNHAPFGSKIKLRWFILLELVITVLSALAMIYIPAWADWCAAVYIFSLLAVTITTGLACGRRSARFYYLRKQKQTDAPTP